MYTLWRGCTLRETNEDAAPPELPQEQANKTSKTLGLEFRSELPVKEQLEQAKEIFLLIIEVHRDSTTPETIRHRMMRDAEEVFYLLASVDSKGQDIIFKEAPHPATMM
jgi:hypothetical protein